MLNAERYKNEILEKSNVVFDFSMSKDKHTIKKCLGVCDNCIFCNTGEHCSNVKVKWLLSEYKEPTKVTRLEYELLKFLNAEGYKYIARDASMGLCCYTSKPTKDTKVWKTNRQYLGVGLLYTFFQFVQWEDSEPTLIQGVLNNCEVVESDL